MRNAVLLLIGVILLYLIPSLILDAVYGPSYGFLAGEDCWEPDGKGGWVTHGQPTGQPPDEPSVIVPLSLYYIPILLPAALLILFMFTPLSRYIDRPTRESRKPSEGSERESSGDPQTG